MSPSAQAGQATKPTIEAEIWSDFACPWCYVGSRRISKAMEQFGDKADVKITWHAFLLDPNFHNLHPDGEPIDEYITAKFGPNAVAMKGRVIQSGAPDGAKFSNWKDRAASFKAHRLVALAGQQEKSHEAAMLLFDKYYEQGQNISRNEALKEVGAALQLPEYAEWIDSDEGSLEVLKDDSEAKQLGIRGVPAFFIRSGKSNTYMLSGAQPVDVFIEAFERVMEEGHNAPAQGES